MAGCLMTGTWTKVRVSLPQTSMAVLTRIKNGWLLNDWHMDEGEGVIATDHHSSPDQDQEWLAA